MTDEFTTAHAIEYLNMTISRLGSMIDPIATDIVHELSTIASNLGSIAISLEDIREGLAELSLLETRSPQQPAVHSNQPRDGA